MPMEWDRYPENWKARSLELKAQTNWTCQHCGRVCRRAGESLTDFAARIGRPLAQIEKPGRYVLTVSPLDHDPENPKARLIVLCSVCHRRYDNRFIGKLSHQKRERRGQLTLPDRPMPPTPLRGRQLSLLPDWAAPYSISNSGE
ncbi:MAG: HNH endonuclease [Leptolyngbyaceae cyanobacterium MO_188.B28]|nr:HNH endonuclease [Leptolyngbyaceae cyanobacterium MO_188.B28]